MACVRLTAGELGQDSKVEVLAGEEWVDISSCCTGFNLNVRVGSITTARIDVLRVELTDGSSPVFLDAASIEKLAVLVDDARAEGLIDA
jgi:hypothetical protein